MIWILFHLEIFDQNLFGKKFKNVREERKEIESPDWER